MGIRIALNHRTCYRYPKPVWVSPHVVRLSPAPHTRTTICSYSLKVTPSEHFINWQQDPYSNRLARVVFPKKTDELCFEVDLIAELSVTNPFDFFLENYAESFPFRYEPTLLRELGPYLECPDPWLRLRSLISEVRNGQGRTIDYLVGINQHLQRQIKYLIRMEPGVQTPEETLALQSGSCRDTAWLMVQLLRNSGLAARFVSGYLIQLAPDERPLEGPSGPEKDVTDLHAWTEVYLPGAGWVGFDPTSGLLAGEGHIPLACSAEPATASPITGFFAEDDQSVVTSEADEIETDDREVLDRFEFSMTVTRIHEDPRVTKPYSDEEWAAIGALGRRVDADLNAGDVRLTMGGEPTFVAIDDRDSPEWNTTALGPKKYALGDEFIRRLKKRFSTGGFLHHGQGKWYPGESLPRWALGLYWRKDGKPIWRDDSLIADEKSPKEIDSKDAHAFIRLLAERLGVQADCAQAAYEDTWYYLWKEHRLPTNVDPFDSKLSDPQERARLARIFEQGLEKVVGYALPLRREHLTDDTSAWVSGAWFLRPDRLYLIPGDSPMGYRLPLDSFPWVSESEYPYIYEQDPMEQRPPLRDREALLRQARVSGAPEARDPAGFVEQPLPLGTSERPVARSTRPPDMEPALGESASWITRTALCTEVRAGVLRIFMPPQHYLEDYLELVAAVEDTAATLGVPVLIEGYTPPNDSRIHKIHVTPDPGVIEVNMHPARCWDELVANTSALYEEARLSRLRTEKFMMDGRHTGTGGGNHIIVGGATPSDSPLLRNPSLLRSLIGYWHNHPSLSYLFSGLFVGPTSQAPRIDEARNDQVYELEIAFQQVPEGKNCPPWLADRIFRDLLIDATGNTHRAEFSIDKLYPAESSTRRLGLLEMRAFEMPPHSRMSLTQHLLLRSLIARFWKHSYRESLVRWRTEIHDRFLLPHFADQDLQDILGELNDSGYPLKKEWFAAHFNFRFPVYGSIEHRGVALELRQAIEPWNVLGEEAAAGATVRYVDSSLERLQVLVNGMVDPRHVVTCNGHRVPLHPTGTNGQFVAGVRYRAWQPSTCLHPTIGVHSPLVFDIVDTWAGRSIGGCTYYVMHPGGRSYETFPVNANEAESRRISRFFKMGHTPGAMKPAKPKISKEFPFTLDLRAV